jgi:hypothetical protein
MHNALYMSTHDNTRESGNAVTLTLLGLAIAILAGVVVLYFVGRSTPVPVMPPEQESDSSEVQAKTEPASDPYRDWGVYNSTDYDFHINFPRGWAVATGTLSTGDPVVTLYPAVLTSSSTIYSHQDSATHVSIYPRGVAAEGIVGDMKPSSIIIRISGASAKDFVLQSGKVWGTMVSFDTAPDSWNEAGFILARTYIEEEELVYMRGDTEIFKEEFDPVTGDHIERSGFIDIQMRALQEQILRSFAFGLHTDESTQTTAGTTTDAAAGLPDVADLITVTTPMEGDTVSSPLSVRGQARGSWYFEGDFPVRLEATDGTILEEMFATAQGEWMTEEFVPFELSLVFDAGSATSGQLVLLRDNPSDTREQDASLTIPLIFTVTADEATTE